MAKGRFVNKSIAIDKALNSMSFEAEAYYLKTLPHLDRDGLILYGDGHELWAQVSPRRINLLERVPEFVNEWLDSALVILYETSEGDVLYFRGFLKNQKGLVYSREAPSIYEPPPGFSRTDSGLEQTDDYESTHELVMSDSRPNHAIVVPKFKYKSKVKSKSKSKGNTASEVAPATNGLLREYTDASGEATNHSPKFKKWFADITSRYTEAQCRRIFSQLRHDIAADKLKGRTKWEHTIWLFENQEEPSDSTGPDINWENVLA